MKRYIKKLGTLALAAVMALTMTSTAFAADSTKATLSVNSSVSGAQYTAYQIMTATKHTGNGSSAVYSYTVSSDFAGFFNGTSTSGYYLNSDNEIYYNGSKVVTDGLTANVNNTVAASLAADIQSYAIANNISGTVLPASLDIGYYLVSETTTPKNNKDYIASKPILVNLTSDVAVTPKKSEIDLEKKIVEDGSKVDENNVSIGDTINYEVTSSIPTYRANVDENKLTYTFTDTFTNVKFNSDSMVVKVGTETLTAGTDYTLTSDDNSFTLALSKNVIYNNQGKNVTLNYSGVLQTTANVDSTTGNPNKIRLEYTNNPDRSDNVDYLEDDVVTYTYGIKIHKVDKNDYTKDMAGARFAIRTGSEDGTIIAMYEYDENGAIKVLNADGTEKTNAGSGVQVTTDGTGTTNYAVIKGLDEGTYYITEEQAPADYSILGSAVKVVITDLENNDLDGIAKIEVSGSGSAEKLENGEITKVSEISDDGNGTINMTVLIENTKGISLPETGSTTMILCMAGGALVIILSGLYFAITRRRNNAA